MPVEQPNELSREAFKDAAGRLVIQYRVERATKRVAWFAAISCVVALILSMPGVSGLIVKVIQT